LETASGPATRALAPIKKTIYSLPDLRQVLLGCNRRYLAFLSALDDFSAGVRVLDRLTRPRSVCGKTVKGVNFFDPTERRLLRALQRPAVSIAGDRRAHLLPVLYTLSPATVSRQLARLRTLPDQAHRRNRSPYRYDLTRLGRSAVAACCRLTEAHHHPGARMTNPLTIGDKCVRKRLTRLDRIRALCLDILDEGTT